MEQLDSITMQAVKACAEARQPVMVVGEPGVGKTASFRKMAKSMGYQLITLIGSQMDPTDVTGLPKGEIVAQDDQGNDIWGTVYLAPWWQVLIIQKKKVMLLLDEWSNTSSSVRASLLTMLENREFPNGTFMPPETIIVGAMNPTELAADGWELDKPTTNRITFLVWKSPRADWTKGMLKAWGEDVSDEEMYWRRRIVGFINDNPTYLQKMNGQDDGTPEAHGVNMNDPSEAEVLRYAWASRRSWSNLAHILAGVGRRNIELQDEIGSGTVGRAACIAFREWMLKNDVINPVSVLNDPKSVNWAEIQVSEANIIFRAVVEMVDSKNWRQALLLLTAIADDDRQALIGAYISDILKKIIVGAKMVSSAELDTARTMTKEVLVRYRSDASPT